jgi:hypothetical protein
MARNTTAEDDSSTDAAVIQILSNPIPAHGKQITEVCCRAPSGGDIMRVGNPVTFNPFDESPENTIQINPPVMGRMISHLAGIPTSSVERMDPQDFMALSWKLVPFFIPGVSTRS